MTIQNKESEQKPITSYIFKCENCGKEIASFSESQAKYNFEQHKLACDKKQLNEMEVKQNGN